MTPDLLVWTQISYEETFAYTTFTGSYQVWLMGQIQICHSPTPIWSSIGVALYILTLSFLVIWIFFQKLYDQGARNFWIHNTGPLGCLAQNVAKFGKDSSKLDELGCVNSHNQAAKLFNLQLHALCKKLQGQFSDANVTYVDIFRIKSDLIANYSRYGKYHCLSLTNPKSGKWFLRCYAVNYLKGYLCSF